MEEQQQSIQQCGETSPAASLAPMTTTEKAKYAAIAGVPSLLVLELLNAKGPGFAIAGLIGYGAWHFSDRIRGAQSEQGGRKQKTSVPFSRRVQSALYWLGTGHAMPESPKQEGRSEDVEGTVETTMNDGAKSSTQVTHPDIPAQFVLGRDSLAAIKEANQMRKVYFGRTATRQVVLDIDEMYHVLDVAKSGRGKSNRFRHAMMQVVGLADTYYLNPFAAPVKSVTDDRKIEVWQPIYDRLANRHPVRESDEILQTLTSLVDEIKKRSDLEQERDFSWRAHPIFVFIDEVPEIYARCPEAPSWLDRIGRGGRQFGVFAWIATQTVHVKDIGLSTASQAQFKTLIYGGGDKTSGNRVMGHVSPEQEKALKENGAGLTLMVAEGYDDTEYVRAPLLTNEALFAYLGLPPFQMKEWLTPKSKQPVQDLSPFHSFTNGVPQAQNTPVSPVKGQNRERRERVKGPNEEAILDALSALQEEEKPLTLNAITRKAGLTWRQADEIEEAAFWYGYEIERGKGRPKEG